ncbi:MAG TPA: hypothetical protein PLI90_03465 [Rhodocyclaceae bacterium]|nr:hypothetical protein [Rhodocyclaceae bacterium]
MQCPFCKEEIQDGATKCKHCNSAIGGAVGSAAGQPATTDQSDFGARLTLALAMWKENLGDLAVMTLVLMLVIWIPIANIGFIAGYTRSVFKVARGQGKASVGDIFNTWDCFVNLLIYLILLVVASMILNFVPILGFLVSMALSFAAMPGIYAIIDTGKNPVDAFKWSLATIQSDFINWLLAYIVGYVITMIGFILLIIGIVLTMPLGSLIMIQQYERAKPTNPA